MASDITPPPAEKQSPINQVIGILKDQFDELEKTSASLFEQLSPVMDQRVSKEDIPEENPEASTVPMIAVFEAFSERIRILNVQMKVKISQIAL